MNANPLFDEFQRTDTSRKHFKESVWEFYNRAGNDRASEVRDMLQRWIVRLPASHRTNAVSTMRTAKKNEAQFDGAFFELFLHEFLQGTGGAVECDPVINGKTPDFAVSQTALNGKTIKYAIEATATHLWPTLPPNSNEAGIIDIIDSVPSHDFDFTVTIKGPITRSPREPALRRQIEELISNAEYRKAYYHQATNGSPLYQRSIQCEDGTVEFALIHAPPQYRPQKKKGFALSLTTRDHKEQHHAIPIREALSQKAKRYQGIENLIIALWFDEGSPPPVDQALFGKIVHQLTIPQDTNTPTTDTSYQAKDGLWHDGKEPKNRHVIGVLAFQTLYPHCVDKATCLFYANPYVVSARLPRWTTLIPHAWYPNGQIVELQGIPPARFVTDYVPSDPFYPGI